MLESIDQTDNPLAAAAGHVTVLAAEAVAALRPRPAGVYIDGTFGGGGHTRELAQQLGPTGRVICIDRDPEAAARFATVVAAHPGQLTFVRGSYADMARHAAALDV